MNIKRIFLFIGVAVVIMAALLAYFFLKAQWDEQQYSGEPPYPLTISGFDTVESTTINPISLLDTIRTGKKLILQVQADIPNSPSLIMKVDWQQSDFLEVAQAYQKAIWQDNPNLWHLYKVSFNTACDRTRDTFRNAEFFYYQEIIKDGKDMYSARGIYVEPEYGYLAWGGDTFFPRSKYGIGTEIDLENDIAKVSAEKALDLADQHGGNDFRKKENNICNITTTIWPWRFERNDWSIFYSGKISTEIWIPIK